MSAIRHCFQTTAVLAGFVLIVSGCAHPPAAPADGTLKGTFVLEGGAVSESGGQPPVRPMDGVVSAMRGTTVVATVRATGGRFTLSLPAGTYTVSGVASGKYENMHCGAASSATVTAKATTSTEIDCFVP